LGAPNSGADTAAMNHPNFFRGKMWQFFFFDTCEIMIFMVDFSLPV